MYFGYHPDAIRLQLSIHAAVVVFTWLIASTGSAADESWAKVLLICLFWFAAAGSYGLCVPIYVIYFSGHVHPRPAWFCIFSQLALNLLTFSIIHRFFGLARDCGDLSVCPELSFGESLYFSIVTFTTLGYGDYQPVGYGKYFAASQALAGYLVLGLTVGAVIFWAQSRRPTV